MNKVFPTSLYSMAILFLGIYSILSFHSRLAGDDFFYLWLKDTYGSWDGMLYQYRNWSGRWSAHFVGCEMISQWKKPYFLPLLNFLTLGMLYFSLKMVVEKILSFLEINVAKILIPSLIFLLITTFFFTSFSIGETWFWYIIILTYLWSIIGFLFLISSIFSEKYKLNTYIFITIVSSYIGGSSESFALIFLFFLFALLIYRWKIKYDKKLNNTDYKIIYAFIILAFSFSFSVFSPGTEIRHSLLPQTSLNEKIFITFKAYFKFFINYLPNKIGYLIIFSFPWLFFGSHYFKNKIEKTNIKKLLKNTTLVFLILLACMYIPTSFIMSETGPARALSIISLLTTFYFAILFSILGVYIDVNKIYVTNIGHAITLISLIVLIYTLYSQYNISKQFANAYDARLKVIEKEKMNKFTGVLDLEKIPPRGMLYWDELSMDTSHFTNKHLKAGLNLTFWVKLKID